MAKHQPAHEADLPSAEESTSPAENAAPAGQQETVAASPGNPLPFWLVTVNGLESKSFHAVDESDAARQFYKAHGVKEPEKFTHRVTRVS